MPETPVRFARGFIGETPGGVRYFLTEGEAEHLSTAYYPCMVPNGAEITIAPSTAELVIFEGNPVQAVTPEGDERTLHTFEDMDGGTFARLFVILSL